MQTLRDALYGLTPQFFDALVLAVIAIGLVLAAIRLRADLRRPALDEDTQPLQE